MIGLLIFVFYIMFIKMNCVYFGLLILGLYMFYIRYSIMCWYGNIKVEIDMFFIELY